MGMLWSLGAKTTGISFHKGGDFAREREPILAQYLNSNSGNCPKSLCYRKTLAKCLCPSGKVKIQ